MTSTQGDDIRAMVARGIRAPRVAIIGAGAGGLCMALRLQDVGLTDFTIYERSDEVGGTWRDNTYPGAACDVPSHLYSFSFAPRSDWSRKFPRQPEIRDYFESLVRNNGLEPHIRTGSEVVALRWDDDRALWELELAGGEIAEAEIVVSALGQLNRPHIPDIEGLDRFRGTMFHSARWNHDHDLSGERVAVIGIGASAIQFVPRIAEQAGELTLFQRSVNYVFPKPDRRFRSWEKWAFAHVPGWRRLYRWWTYWNFEARFLMMRKNSRLGAQLQRLFGARISAIASPELPEEALVPDYSPGCRRILIANDWYPTLLRPNVTVVTDGVARITEDAVVDGAGNEYPADTIVFGTGFRTTEFLAPMAVTGSGGRDLDTEWADGASAYMGVAVPGFANLFMLYGPNTNLGHNSILFMIEQQVHLIRQVIAEMMRTETAVAEVDPAAMAEYEREIEAAVKRTVWDEDCSNWYKNEAGRITNNWPGSTVAYRMRMRRRPTRAFRFSSPQVRPAPEVAASTG